MSFLSCEEMLAAARSQKITLAEAVLRSDLEESRLTEAHSRAAMRHLWQVMQATSQEYDPAQRSRSGLSGGDAAKVEQAWQQGRLLGDDYLAAVTAEALKTAECNACMKRIVAAPTAGSCGVLPAVLLPLARAGQADEDAVCDALYVAAGFGQVIAARATLAGAEGGCQAEVGAASAMAAAALCNLKGGTPEQCAAAAAMALGNLLGLVCDPVAGLVEVPCIKRNVVGQRFDALHQRVKVGVVGNIDKRFGICNHPSVLFEVRQVAHSLHGFERDDEVGLTQGYEVGSYGRRADAQVGLHVAAALAHAVHLGLLDIKVVVDSGGTDYCGYREDALASYSRKYYVCIHGSSSRFIWFV